LSDWNISKYLSSSSDILSSALRLFTIFFISLIEHFIFSISV
jgi:hypothetical protein